MKFEMSMQQLNLEKNSQGSLFVCVKRG